MSTGKVSYRTYWKYFRTGDSLWLIYAIDFGFLIVSAASSFSDYWLGYW